MNHTIHASSELSGAKRSKNINQELRDNYECKYSSPLYLTDFVTIRNEEMTLKTIKTSEHTKNH